MRVILSIFVVGVVLLLLWFWIVVRAGGLTEEDPADREKK